MVGNNTNITAPPSPLLPQKTVAVIGGGIGGALTALNLLDAGFTSVTLFELNADLHGS